MKKENRSRVASILTLAAVIASPVFIAVDTASCKHVDAGDVKSAAEYLDEAAMACIFTSDLVDAQALTKACKIANKFIPLIQNLIRQREGARTAGVRWTTSDGGAVISDAGKP